MHRTLLAAGAVLSLAAPLSAQAKPETAAFLVRLGNDTIAAERFTRSKDKLEGDLVAMAPRARLVHYVATLGADGTIKKIESTSQPYASGAPTQGANATMGDTVFQQLRLGDSSWTQKIPARPGAVPMLSYSFALYEQVTRQARASGKDSVNFDLVFFGPNRAYGVAVAKRGADSMMVEYFGSPAYTKVDQQGRLLGWNGLATTQKFIVERFPDLDVKAIGLALAAGEQRGRARGPLSPRDTVRATVGEASLMIDYGRPFKRGRLIFGEVVPWNVVWRTGANAATQFSTDKDLVIGGVTVPAGNYTLWTVPTPSGGTLIVNSQTGQWGTEYDQSKDFARIPLSVEKLGKPLEQFTISIVPSDSGAVLRLDWDTSSYSAPIALK
jgi:hypothetical protein